MLGDIVDSAPAYVGPPAAGYRAGFETASYPAFAATWSGRRPYLYVGANDGMLHALDAATGAEKFAYVPNLVFPLLSSLTKPTYANGFTVDGSPAVADVFYSGGWHTLLVSGLRAGGRGLFALDVTDPTRFNEAQAASVVRWEFSDPALGHVYAPPQMVKTRNGRWSVIVGNGYNASGSGGTAQLFVIDAETGALLRRIDTGAGNASSPNGLSGATAVDVDGDGIVDVAYAGDLDGNLWKFDLSNADPARWQVGIGGSPLFAAGAGKPITSAPDVTVHPKGGYMVVFGTGRYLGTGDISNNDVQSAYGIWDYSGTAVTTGQLQTQKIEADTASALGTSYRFSTHRVGPATDNVLAEDLAHAITRNDYYTNKRGWTIDLPTSGERIVVDPDIRGGLATFTTSIPTAEVCSYGGTSWRINVDVFTGNRPDTATFDTNGDKRVTSADFLRINASATGLNNATGWLIDGLATQGRAMSYKSGSETTEHGFIRTSKGTTEVKVEAGRPGSHQRSMWHVVE